MYFSSFPSIYYEFDIGGTIELRPIADITHNVRFRKEVLNNVTLYNTYDIKDGETPDILADRVYGSSQYHWAIMLFNERFDFNGDWPMAQDMLDEYINEEYSEEIPNGLVIDALTNEDSVIRVLRYYNKPLTAAQQAMVPVDSITLAIPNLTDGDHLIYNVNGGTNLFTTTVTDVYAFLPEPTNFPYSFKLASSKLNALNHIPMDMVYAPVGTSRGTLNYSNVEHHSEFLSNGLVVNKDNIVTTYNATSDSIITLTNYDHEVRLNDRKRSIKLIDSSLLKQIIKEFKIII